jgi:hypothetical protein
MHDVAVFQPLVEMLTGKKITDYQPSSSSPSSEASTAIASPASGSGSSSTFNFEGRSPESVQPHAQAAEMARIDRENALVLVSELLKNRGKDMAVMRRTLFEDLLKGGTEVMLSYKEAKPLYGEKLLPKEERARAGLNLQEAAQESVSELS